jgi:hypothetical protein
LFQEKQRIEEEQHQQQQHIPQLYVTEESFIKYMDDTYRKLISKIMQAIHEILCPPPTTTTTAESKSKTPPPPFLLEVSKAFQEIKNTLLQQVRQHSLTSSEHDKANENSNNSNNHNDSKEQQELYFHNLFLFQFQEKFLFHILNNHRILQQDPHDHHLEQETLKEQQENGFSEEHINTINDFIEQLFRSK